MGRPPPDQIVNSAARFLPPAARCRLGPPNPHLKNVKLGNQPGHFLNVLTQNLFSGAQRDHIANLVHSPCKLGEWCSDEIRALGLERGGGFLNQCGFLAGDAHTMKIETLFGKPAVWMYRFW